MAEYWPFWAVSRPKWTTYGPFLSVYEAFYTGVYPFGVAIQTAIKRFKMGRDGPLNGLYVGEITC